MDQSCTVLFLGLIVLMAFIWMLNYILDIFSPHPESLPAPKKFKPEEKLPLVQEKDLISPQKSRSPTRKETSTLKIDGVLPNGNNAINNLDETVQELKASLAVSTRKEKIFENLHQEFVEETEKKLRQLEVTFDAEKSVLMQVVRTLKSGVSYEEQERQLKPTPDARLNVEEERLKQLESVAKEANRQLSELNETSTQVITELKAVIAEQKSLSEERTRQYEEASRELQEFKETSVKEIMELKTANETSQTIQKAAEEKRQILEEMLANAIKEAEALKSEKSNALAEQKSLFEDRVKQLELVAEEAKLQLIDLKETMDRSIAGLKLSNEDGQMALKVAEKKLQSMEKLLLERTQAAESLSNEQAAALAEAINTLQLAVKHAKDEASGVAYPGTEKPVGDTETLEEWLIKHGLLTRVPPQTWMQLLENTGFLIGEKANNLQSKADLLFHSKPSDTKTR